MNETRPRAGFFMPESKGASAREHPDQAGMAYIFLPGFLTGLIY